MNNGSDVTGAGQDSGGTVVVYGTRWCAATQYVRRYLDRNNVTHTFCDIDRDSEAADQVRWWNGGNLSHPTVKIASDILVEPLSNEIQSSLEKNNIVLGHSE
jgi:mycoredoxin